MSEVEDVLKSLFGAGKKPDAFDALNTLKKCKDDNLHRGFFLARAKAAKICREAGQDELAARIEKMWLAKK